MPIDISTSDLARLARQSDVELRVEGQGNDQQLHSRDGTLGGRFARWFKKTFTEEDRTTKQGQYMKAGQALYQSLLREYGPTIAGKAYLAGTGHSHDQHQSSSPITGRKIALMIDTAQRELTREDPYREIGFAPKSFTDLRGKTITVAPTLMWFQHSSETGHSPSELDWKNMREKRHDMDRLQHQGQSGVPGFKKHGFEPTPLPDDPNAPGVLRKGLERGAYLAQRLLNDIGARQQDDQYDPDARQDFWQLETYPTDGGPGSVIGLRIDRNDPNTVHVFDARRGEYTVPKDGLSSWLGQQLKGDGARYELQRIEQKPLTGRFVQYDGGSLDDTVKLDQLTSHQREHLNDLTHHSELVERPNSPPLAKQFLLDVERQTTVVKTEDDGIVGRSMTLGNCGQEMLDLVAGAGNEEETIRAAGNLSQLVGQTAFGAMTNAFYGALRDENLMTLDLVAPENGRARTVEIGHCRMDDGRPGIEITYRNHEQLAGLGGMDHQRGTSPGTDYCRTTMTIQVAIEDLAKQGTPPYTVTQQPIREYHVEQPREPMDIEGELIFQPSRNNPSVQVLPLDDFLPETYRQDWLDTVDQRGSTDRSLRRDTGLTLSEHCLDTVINSGVSIRVGNDVLRPLHLQHLDQSIQSLLQMGYSEEEILEISRYIDSQLLVSLAHDVARSLGVSDETALTYFRDQPQLTIGIERGDDGKLIVGLTTDITRLIDNETYQKLRGLPQDRDGKRLTLGVRFGLDVREDGSVSRTLLPPPLMQSGPTPTRREGYPRAGHLTEGLPFVGGIIDKAYEITPERTLRVRDDLAGDLRLPDPPYSDVDPGVIGDIGRGNRVTVGTGQGIPRLMTSDNVQALLTEMVQGGTPEETQRAVRRLSQLLSVNSSSAILAPGREPIILDDGVIPGGSSGDPRIGIVRDEEGGFVELTVSSNHPMIVFTVDGPVHGGSGLTDSFVVTGKFRLSLEALRGLEDPVPEILQSPQARLHIEGYRGPVENQRPGDPRNDLPEGRRLRDRLEFTPRDGGILIGNIDNILPPGWGRSWDTLRQKVESAPLVDFDDRQISLSGLEVLRHGTLGNGRAPWECEHDDGTIERSQALYEGLAGGLGDQGGQLAGQLSRLLDEELMTELYRQTALVLGATNEDTEQMIKNGPISIDARRDDDGWVTLTLTKNVDSLMTYKSDVKLQSNPSLTLESRGITEDTHTIDLTVRLRVREEHLLDGHPERFEVVHGARLEIAPLVTGDDNEV